MTTSTCAGKPHADRQTVKLGDVCEIKYGKEHKKLADGDIPCFGSGGIMRYVDKPIYDKKSVLIPRKGSLDNIFFADMPFWSVDTMFYSVINETKVMPEYLYYYLKTMNFGEMNVGTAVPSMTTAVLNEITLTLPPLAEQRRVAGILGSLDEKIENNRRLIRTAEALARTLFKKHIVSNEESEGWENTTLGEIITNYDRQRVPLSSVQREQKKGKYPYYGATSIMDYVDEYLFDGRYLLLAEDGSVIKADNTPYLQIVDGKFWVNNHAHIIQAKPPFTIEYLYLLLSQTNVQPLVSGAVQLKINQAAMNRLEIKLPSAAVLQTFNAAVEPLFAEIGFLTRENQTLAATRDKLLRRLIK